MFQTKTTNTGYIRCLSQFRNNEIKQELTKKKYYFGDDSDERLYIDIETQFYFGEGRNRSQRGGGIFGTIFSTALPLVGEIVKVFK